jgi:hypothetical protein
MRNQDGEPDKNGDRVDVGRELKERELVTGKDGEQTVDTGDLVENEG